MNKKFEMPTLQTRVFDTEEIVTISNEGIVKAKLVDVGVSLGSIQTINFQKLISE